MLIAVAGYSGAGKTTVLDCLQARTAGGVCYLGVLLRQGVVDRGLELTAENERLVRAQLHEECGVAALALQALPDIRCMAADGLVLLDAVYCAEEWQVYEEGLHKPLMLVAVRASFEVRAHRLARRMGRELTRDDLLARDTYEEAGMSAVLHLAHRTIDNDGDLGVLHASVKELIAALTGC